MPASNKSTRTTIGLEALEDRLTPAASCEVWLGDLYVTGTDAGETITVSRVTTGYRVAVGAKVFNVSFCGVWGGDVFISGLGGDDTLINNTALATWAYGGKGNDDVFGSSNHDYLDGGEGMDDLFGKGGNDTLVAGQDFSTNNLYGGAGNDVLYGGMGNDDLFGDRDHGNDPNGFHNLGNDVLYGGFGDDLLEGGNGNDYLYGEDGADVLLGGEGDDVLDGGIDPYHDSLEGGGGKDYFRRDVFQLDSIEDFNSSYDKFYD
jgi:Ca2+-binding RTX toxin-like protein